MSPREALSDLEYVRTLAEEGRAAPLLGGAHYAIIGSITALAFASHYWIVTVLAQPQWVGLSWLVYGGVFGVSIWLLQRRLARKPGVTAVSNRVEAAVWGGVNAAGFAIATAAIGRLILEGDPTAPNIIPGAYFALYGAAQITTASMTRQSVLRAAGWVSIAVAFAAMLFADAPWMYLLTAGGALLVLTVPGLVMLAREPKDVV